MFDIIIILLLVVVILLVSYGIAKSPQNITIKLDANFTSEDKKPNVETKLDPVSKPVSDRYSIPLPDPLTILSKQRPVSGFGKIDDK